MAVLLPLIAALQSGAALALAGPPSGGERAPRGPHEFAGDPPPPAALLAARRTSPAARITFNGFTSVQVNVDAQGRNVLGDAANEPSIAIDPNRPDRIAIGWRQFDAVASNFRQAGHAWSDDGGRTWTFPGVLEPGIFRTDPVLGADAAGNFFYHSMETGGSVYSCDVFRSQDGGKTWSSGVYAYGGDKAWMDIDRSGGPADGNLYAAWDDAGCCGDNRFNRSRDGATTFEAPVPIPEKPIYGVTAVGPDGELYTAGRRESTAAEIVVAKSAAPGVTPGPPAYDFGVQVDLGGGQVYFLGTGPNPGGLLGQIWVAVDRSNRPTRGNVYVLASVDPPGVDPLDVHFIRSIDGGKTWSTPVQVNEAAPAANSYQWFGTMSVAPNGRIDVVWNDTRADPKGVLSQLRYSYSIDAGRSWSPPVAVGPVFDPHLGWPNQDKLGDYYDMVSDATGAGLAYAATYNGEQDVYYVRIDCAPVLPGNLDPRSLRLVKGSGAVPCLPGQIAASWRELVPPVAQTYNLHEIIGFANRPTIANPYPGSALATAQAATALCYAPSFVPAADVGYYGVFQANECSGATLADP